MYEIKKKNFIQKLKSPSILENHSKFIWNIKKMNPEIRLKKITLEGVFEFLHLDSQLYQNFKPTRNLSGQFFYIH